MSFGSLSISRLALTPGTGGGSLLSRVQDLFDGGTYPGFIFKASRFDEEFFYQESTYQTLVTATTQSIGGAIDASRMGALGASEYLAAQTELLSTGTTGLVGTATAATYDTGTGAGTITRASFPANQSYVTFPAEPGRKYRLDATGPIQGIAIRGSVAGALIAPILSTTRIVVDIVATTSEIVFTAGANATVSFTVHSLKEVEGFNATQSTSNSRPTLQQPSKYAFRFDGVDDYLATALNPQSSGAMICAGTLDASSDLVMGSADGTPNRCFLGLNASGYLGAGIGSDSYSTIAGSTDITGVDGFNALRWNGTTVQLNRDDTSTPIYSAGQNGTPVNSRPIYLGAYNNAGTAGLFADADIDFFFAIMGRELSNDDLALIKAYRDQ